MTTLLFAALAAGSGIALIYIGGRVTWGSGIGKLVEDLGSALVVSVALAGAWELFGRRAFAQEIMETSKVSGEITEIGLAGFGFDRMRDVDWHALLRGTRELDLVLSQGSTWRNAHLEPIRDIARSKGKRIRIFLPDPTAESVMQEIGHGVNLSPQAAATAIEETRLAYERLAVPDGATIEIYYRPHSPLFALYRFDSCAVLHLYSYGGGRRAAPVLTARPGGRLHTFITSQFGIIEAESQLVSRVP